MRCRNQIQTLRTLLLLGGAMLAASCVQDDRSDCRFPLRVEFQRATNAEVLTRAASDDFNGELEELTLYLYDRASGQLVAEVQPPMEAAHTSDPYVWPVPPGTYRVVAWGGAKERHTVTAHETFDGATLSVNRLEDGVSVEARRAHLYYGQLDSVVITGDYTPAHRIDLYKNSKDIRLELVGLTAEERNRAVCTVTASNGTYLFDNTLLPEQDPVTYLMTDTPDAHNLIRTFTTLGLQAGDDSHLRIELLPEAPVTGDEETPQTRAAEGHVIYDGSLSELLLARPGTDLKWDDEFVIKMNYYGQAADGSSHLDIWVNDWHIIHQNGDLE